MNDKAKALLRIAEAERRRKAAWADAIRWERRRDAAVIDFIQHGVLDIVVAVEMAFDIADHESGRQYDDL